jgi:rRNA maturation endonuclease Nob1
MTTKTIQIICTSPGMRRNGQRHPASAFYPADHWDGEQMAAFARDPNFVVREVEDSENTQTDADFEMRVAAEVDKRVAEKEDALARAFDGAVSDKVAERISEFESKIVALEAKLKAQDTPEPQATSDQETAAKPAAKPATGKK